MTYQDSTPEKLYEIIRLVRPLYKTLEASVAQELEKTGITVSQRAVLEQLQDQGALTVPAIGRRLILPRQFIQKIANELLEVALIERLENVAHKRSPLFTLTQEGRVAIEAIKARETEIMRPIAKALKPGDIEVTRAVMAGVIAAFSAHNARIPQGAKEETT